MTNELTTRQDGELRADGVLVVAKEEKPNGTLETRKVGVLKVRGESKSRLINYADYAKLLTFYQNQARLIKDRKHVMVALSGGVMINTADITSLELTEAVTFVEHKPEVPEDVANLPVEWTTWEKENSTNYFEGLCHYKTNPDGTKTYIDDLEKIKEARVFTKDQYGRPVLCQIYKYGIPQL